MNSFRSRRRAVAAAVTAALLPAIAQADPTSEELLQKIEVQDEATRTAVTTTPVVKASPRGLSLATADNQNRPRLRSVMHLEALVGGAPAGADMDDEKVFLTRFALGF